MISINGRFLADFDIAMQKRNQAIHFRKCSLNWKRLLLLLLLFCGKETFAQISNNFITYTNGFSGILCEQADESDDINLTPPAGTVFTTVTEGGTKNIIPVANLAEFTPNIATAPFNAPGTYFIFETTNLSSSNNKGAATSPYAASNVSNSSTVLVTSSPSATISYAGSPYCKSSTANVTLTGTKGGAFSSTTGLSISAINGEINLGGSTVGTYTVTYTITATGSSPEYTATTNVIINPLVGPVKFVLANSSRCNGAETITYTATAENTTGITYSLDAASSAAGNTINEPTGEVTYVASWTGTTIITANASGCTPTTANHTVTINSTPTLIFTLTPTCIGSNTGVITVNGNGGQEPYLYSFNSGSYQKLNEFTKKAAGDYTISLKDGKGCITSEIVTISPFENSSDDQTTAGTDSWIGHIYKGKNFEEYKGYFTEPETFEENFGGSNTCFPITSSSGPSSIFTIDFSVKFKMTSTKKGLYIVNLGSDDGSRLYVDNELVFDNWFPQSFIYRMNNLLSLKGNSSLNYEYYENTDGNKVGFDNLQLLLENKLSLNNLQKLCPGTPGMAISGDVFGTIPTNISIVGTSGYQWNYSTSPEGPRISITGATGATFTPGISAPFNNSGTYYLYRNASLKSKNFGVSNYIVSNESNPAIIVISASSPGTWTGAINADWNNPENWACGGIPNSTTNVTIKENSPNYPSITSAGEAKNILIKKDGSIVINGGTLNIYGQINNSGNFDVVNGTLGLNGVADQNIAGSMFKDKTIQNLAISHIVSVSPVLKDTLKISGTLSFGNVTTTLNTGDNITLLSTAGQTASVGIVKSGDKINGKVTVERYINIGTGPGQHAKSWQLLSAPTTEQTIKDAWMEAGLKTATPNGYGTWISGATGITGGFDVQSGTPSMKTYNSGTNTWVTITNPDTTQIHNDNGYLIFVRGDRSVFNFSGSNSSPVTTILRTTGNLITGDQHKISLPVGKYQCIGNPYAAAIDFSKVTKSPGVDNKFYVWDPHLIGSYGLGGYQTISNTNYSKPVPGGTQNYPLNISTPAIQSGQAFLVFTTGIESETNYTLSFTESAKLIEPASGSFARPMGNSGDTKRKFFGVSLYTGSDKNSLIADGNIVVFDEIFSNQVDGDDALKIMNEGENFGLKRNGKLLAVEAREMIENTDTIYYSFSNLKQKNYQLRFVPENMESTGLQAYLMDKFLGTENPISLAQNSEIDIVITGVAGSAKAERFSVIFRPMAPLPVSFTSIKAAQKNADIQVEWKVENEKNMSHYVVEKSLDGIHFSGQSTIKAANENGNQYNWTDKKAAEGNNYYRIRSLDMNGLSSYTQIVKVVTGKILLEISIRPNPVIDGSIKLYLINQPSGVYGIRLLDPLGKVILSKTIKHVKESEQEIIRWNNKRAKGVYQLEINKPDGEIQFIKIMN